MGNGEAVPHGDRPEAIAEDGRDEEGADHHEDRLGGPVDYTKKNDAGVVGIPLAGERSQEAGEYEDEGPPPEQRVQQRRCW